MANSALLHLLLHRSGLTWGAVRSGELESADGLRAAPLFPDWDWTGLEGGRDLLGLWPPSESLPWLLGGVGGSCRLSDEAAAGREEKGQ